MDRTKFRSYNPLRNFQSINEIPIGKNMTCSTFSRNKVFLVRELRNIERINTEMSYERTIYDYPMVFLNNAAESIKQ
jgi:hypothetical protein